MVFSFLIGLGPLQGSGQEGQREPIRVVVTTPMLTDMVKNVADKQATVIGLMGPGIDPHLYKATAADVAQLAKAELIFYHGLHLEGRMAELFAQMKQRGEPVWAATAAIPEEALIATTAFKDSYDPHIWFDPQLWALCLPVIVEGLSQVDPDNAELYSKRGEQLSQDYRRLHLWGQQRIEALSQDKRILITSHDAFNYFGRAYDFLVIGIQGISTLSEAGLADITRIVDFIREKQIKAIFAETSVSPAAVERISEDAGVVIGGRLFSDAMGTPGHLARYNREIYDLGTYSGMYKHNINTIVEALK